MKCKVEWRRKSFKPKDRIPTMLVVRIIGQIFFIVDHLSISGLDISIIAPGDEFPGGHAISKGVMREIPDELFELALDYPEDRSFFEQAWLEFKDDLFRQPWE